MNNYPELDVLIPLCETRAGLAVVRSFAAQGISFVISYSKRNNIVYWSRHAKHAAYVPFDASDKETYFRENIAIAEKYRVKMIMPISDTGIVVMNQYREQIPHHIKLALPKSNSVKAVLNKNISYDVARRAGVPCPNEFDLTSKDQIPEMINELGLPIVLKNPNPHADTGKSSFEFRVLIAHTEENLRQYIEQYCQSGNFPIFMEYASGKTHNVCCFSCNGKVMAMHEYISRRKDLHEGVYREITPLHPVLEKHCRALLSEMNWDGVAQLQFIVNEERDKIWYMETNGRFWASVQGSINAGWDFPIWHYDFFQNSVVPNVSDIQIGSCTRWHRGDLKLLVMYLMGDRSPEFYTHPGKWISVIRYLKGFSPKVGTDVFRLSDPMPALIDHWYLIVDSFKYVFKKRWGV